MQTRERGFKAKPSFPDLRWSVPWPLFPFKTLAVSAVTLGSLALGSLQTVSGQEVTLRVHRFMPGPSTLPAQFIAPWEAAVEDASNGRIEIEVYHAMALGGSAPQLYDQVVDGAVDIILTLPGYTPGRFPKTEVFELPFFVSDTVASSGAFYELIDEELQNEEYEEAKILAAWTHGPGVLHTKTPVLGLDDLQGLELRGPTRLATQTIAALGATPVGMPLPAIPENLSKGVIDGAVVPWEITPAIRLQELAGHHLEIGSDPALYTATFIFAMNWESYENMPADLQAILDQQTGLALSMQAGQIVADADVTSKAIVADSGAIINTLTPEQAENWAMQSAPVTQGWIEEMAAKGVDAPALIEACTGPDGKAFKIRKICGA